MRIKIYSDSAKDELKNRFIKAIKDDPRILTVKLQSCGMPRGTYSSILNNKGGVSRKTAESMRSFIEKRAPRFKEISSTKRYCVLCEDILHFKKMHDKWNCTECRNDLQRITIKERLLILSAR